MSLPVLAPVLGVLGLLMAFAVYRYVVAQPAGSGPMIEIADAIESGAMAFLPDELPTVEAACLEAGSQALRLVENHKVRRF